MEITQVIARPQNFVANDIASALQDIEEDARIDREEQEIAAEEYENEDYEMYGDYYYDELDRIEYDGYHDPSWDDDSNFHDEYY
jgi:hypothetical protein